jgi:hypothetical protein
MLEVRWGGGGSARWGTRNAALRCRGVRENTTARSAHICMRAGLIYRDTNPDFEEEILYSQSVI